MQPLYPLLGRQLAYYRLKAGLTQAQLAEKADYTTEFISLVERGKNAPTVARLQQMAKIIGVEVWQLFYPLPPGKTAVKRRARSKQKRKPRQ